MTDEDLARVQALVDAGKPLNVATGRALLDEVVRLRAATNGHIAGMIRPIAPEGTDPSQTWFWTPKWQQMEREANEDIAAGREKTFDDIDALFDYLDRER